MQRYRDRIAELRARRINPQKLTTARATSTLLQNTQSSDNLRNLLEMPVLFYFLCLTPFMTGAWIYVPLRIAHSAVHLTYNRVIHRFEYYVASCVALFSLWGLLVWRLAITD
jgi:hypothetical protein